MKKAFDANVSRARPRLRLGSFTSEVEAQAETAATVEAIAAQIAREEAAEADDTLAAAVRARAAVAHAPPPTVEERFSAALASGAPPPFGAAAVATGTESFAKPLAHGAPPQEVVEVQTAPLPAEEGQTARRERLKSRLRAVRENPRPEPIPDTVTEAGARAVERIALLQGELSSARALNLSLTQDLEAARRQAERATEEARLRMDEAKRLAGEMEARAALLKDLEHELGALEAERNEALLALQETRQRGEARERERVDLERALQAKDQEVEECLAEEERLAAELEATRQSAATFRKSAELLKEERDTLARQVADLTRERGELLDARKALEAVHRALSAAAVR